MKNPITISALVLLLASQYVSGFGSLVSQVPNGSENSCNTCHGPGFNPFLNDFGISYDDNGRKWDAVLAAIDSDGDTFTNGQELGDPDGDLTPIAGAQVTNPGEVGSVPALTAVSVSITSPNNGFVSQAVPYLGPIVASTADSAESITQIEFFSGQDLLGSVTELPFSLAVNLSAGSHVLTARATNYLGATGDSQPITINVGGSNWYSDASDLADGWRYFDWFKGFKPEAGNWIYHGRHGWMYVMGDTGGLYLWDEAMGRWLFTTETAYPWMYVYGSDAGWVFFFEDGRPGSRSFKRADTGAIVSENGLSLPR